MARCAALGRGIWYRSAVSTPPLFVVTRAQLGFVLNVDREMLQDLKLGPAGQPAQLSRPVDGELEESGESLHNPLLAALVLNCFYTLKREVNAIRLGVQSGQYFDSNSQIVLLISRSHARKHGRKTTRGYGDSRPSPGAAHAGWDDERMSENAAPVFSQLNIVVSDMGATLAFYRRLGLPVEGEPDTVHARAALPNGLLLEWDTAEFAAQWDSGSRGATPNSTVIGFAVATRQGVDDLYADLTAAGYHGRQRPWDAFWGARYAIVEDPDGNPVGLMSPIEAEHRSPPAQAPAT